MWYSLVMVMKNQKKEAPHYEVKCCVLYLKGHQFLKDGDFDTLNPTLDPNLSPPTPKLVTLAQKKKSDVEMFLRRS